MTEPLLATYRLQLGPQLALRDVIGLVDYLHALGISHVYVSPLLRAAQESRHGYDVVDHNTIDPELGSHQDLERLSAALQRRGMGLILDVVPNHMGIDDSRNVWWQDVLEHGRHSPFAKYFDIDWSPPKQLLQGRVLLPVLGDQYGNVLERGELQLEGSPRGPRLRYFSRTFPIAVGSWIPLLRLMLDQHLSLEADDPQRLELESIVTAISHLPFQVEGGEITETSIRSGLREEDVVRRRLATLLDGASALGAAWQATLSAYNGQPGCPASFDALEGLLEQQAYRLCFWQVAADEINYRRFFDVNELAALRVEDPDVFQAAHALVFRFLREGLVSGLRIDHPDGLLDPEQYLTRLQEGFATSPAQHDAGRSLFVVVEKILRSEEPLPASWPVQGTTGYDFLNDVNGLLVDRRKAAQIKEIYAAFTGVSPRFAEIGYQSKRDILAHHMSSELHMLAGRLDRISEQHRSSRDFTLASLGAVLGETIACFPVYRSYIRPGVRPVADEDRRVVQTAIRAAQRRNPGISPSLFHFLERLLMLEDPPGLSESQQRERQDFVLRFQQLTGPVTAKGLEDTALYRAFPLASLNEVGGEPGEFGVSLEQFHRRLAARRLAWPRALLATTTHDTKRSEDVRAKISVLSEIPDAWNLALQRWRTMNRRHKSQVEGSEAPDANEEYLYYQTLVGTWPPHLTASATPDEYVTRIADYVLKAVREAKLHTSWAHPHEEYELAVRRFVERTLTPEPENQFLRDLSVFEESIAAPAACNSLAQTVLKIAAPGIPDFYQGTELWDDRLVDPDNRRPVDFRRLIESLSTLVRGFADDACSLTEELLSGWRDGRLKQFVIWRGLQWRKRWAHVLAAGEYFPLLVEGPRAEHLVAFARRTDRDWLLVIVPRWTSELYGDSALQTRADCWCDTFVVFPTDAPRDWLHAYAAAAFTAPRPATPVRRVAANDLLSHFPVGLWSGSTRHDESRPESDR